MRSTFLIFIVLFSVFVFGCTTEKLDIDPTNYFDTAQLGGFKYKVIRCNNKIYY